MKLTLPYKLRASIYVFNILATPVMVYLRAKNFIGDLEMTLWGAEVAAAMSMAGLNVTKPKDDTPAELQ